ncbi:hypothetical protein C8Q80DRAFT_1203455 [Daedaleopsis nitida]|nr:hypothetical protein C8Q80DRAFT_1203419 [Daedaleopsis nitida]KAI0739034.1 hypothetical protein C8Q80DRAFT_1203455 [Daedaleopsis nitida]
MLTIALSSCEGWYHFGCVGLKSGDPRLEPNAEFMCPPCEVSRCVAHAGRPRSSTRSLIPVQCSEIREQRRAVRYKDAAWRRSRSRRFARVAWGRRTMISRIDHKALYM